MRAKNLPADEPPGKRGGRPRTENHNVLEVISHALTAGIRWNDVPQFGCSGETARCRLFDWQEMNIWDHIHLEILKALREDHMLEHDIAIINSVRIRAFWEGEETGPSPVDRRKPKSKITLMTDLKSTPLALTLTGANRSDHPEIPPGMRDES